MPIDFNTQEMQLLLRQFERGNVVLFAGAGFSLGARNTRGEDPPLGGQLAEALARECGWDYSGEELGVVYDEAQKHLGTQGLRDLLNSRYRDCVPAAWHSLVAKLLWYRIYTTNIDDVIENAYVRCEQKLRLVVFPSNYAGQDPWYESVQCIHLHGSVLEPEKGFTFSPDEYAQQTARPNPWYQALMDDLQANSALFVGTRLNEPPMYHYLALRAERIRGVPESRAKAFVVSPSVSPIRRRQLESQGYVVVDAEAEEFFRAAYAAVSERIPTRMALLMNRYPHQIRAITEGVFQTEADLLRQFEFIRADALPPARRRAKRELFYEGAEPTWDDISNGLDATRSATAPFLESLRGATTGANAFALVGHAGSGKTTMMRRLAYALAREGRLVYVSKATEVINKRPVLNFLAALGERHVYLFVDDAGIQLEVLEEIAASIGKTVNVTLVLIDRPHIILPRLRSIPHISPTIVEMPALDRDDCERIIEKLEEFGVLGELRGMSRADQLRQFLGRSKKQLLVAMKEATSGRGFDVILTHEFNTLSGENARLAYLIASMTYMHGAPVRRRHLFACMNGTDAEKASVLANDLREVLIPWKDSTEFYSPRHRLIAHQVATEISMPGSRADGVLNFLSVVSGDITPTNITRRTPEFIAYRGLINFDNMVDLFGEDYEVISGIYNELKAYYPDDFLFWLQFGRAEVHFDHFDIAENYLNQSLGIREVGNFQALHNLGVLYLKRARIDSNDATADADARRGEEILRAQLVERGNVDSYPYAALVTHKLRYLRAHGSVNFAKEVEALVRLAEEGIRKYPMEEAMQEAHQTVMREYLMIAVSRPE